MPTLYHGSEFNVFLQEGEKIVFSQNVMKITEMEMKYFPVLGTRIGQ